ncbi:protein kintoun-like [Lineus longissimus]|uniref:protein kintoun-like n=1 Tax=Lineus longissimus TaxID=88925 RepID=UPI002B4C43AA
MASTESRTKNWKDLDITPEEVERLSTALKNEEFRKLFVEYAEEISDPDNRRKYEEEIAQMEGERGMDITFINPEPGYVLKTTVNGDNKAFINICSNEHIEKPSSTSQVGPDGKKGLQWSIPHSFSPVRDDLDKLSKKCKVYDVVFHPDTLRMANSNERFQKIIEDTAFDGIMRSFDVKLDKKNKKLLKMKFKGTPQATVIRKKKSESSNETPASTETNGNTDDPLNFPYPYDNCTTDEKSKKMQEEILNREEAKRKQAEKTQVNGQNEKEDDDDDAVPKYSIVHRSELDIQEYRDAPDARTSTRPTELVVTVDLPLLKSAASVDLDIMEKKLILISTKPAAYKLDLNLPYPVDEANGSAKFDKNKRKLTVTLPVIPDERKGLTLDIAPDENVPSKPEGLPDLIPVNEDLSNSKPLIEVLHSDDFSMPAQQQSIDSGDLPDSSGEGEDYRDEKCIWSSEDVGDEKFVPKISYSFPNSYDVSQDDQTVSCVIQVKKVSIDSVSKSFSADKRTVTLKFVTVGAGGFPCHYCYCVRFPESCSFVPEQAGVDVMDENLVLLLLKEKSCRQEWKSYQVGLDENSFEEKLFVTEESLGESLDHLTSEASHRDTTKTDSLPPFKVSDLNEEKLVIEVGGNPFLSDSDTDHSPREIEVVHQKATPNIPSILRRTVSESSASDDLSSSWNGRMGGDPAFSRESSRQDSWSASETETGEGRLRKSVSFNEHIDMTTFRSTQAVTTMKTALKSKRRRQRKKDQKQDRRRRHSSTGSECSSSDDTPFIGMPPCGKAGNLDTLPDETSDLSLPQKDVDRTIGRDDVHAGGIANKISDDELRTSVSDEVVGGDSNEQQEGDSMEKEEEDSVKQSWEELGDADTDKQTPDNAKQMSDNLVADGFKDKIKVLSKEAASDDEDDVDERTGGSCDGDAANSLSWDDKASSGVDCYENEHKTQCAFNFSNSVIYDLDVD